MKNLKKDLQAVNKEIKTLTNKVKKMIVAVEKSETRKPTKKVVVKKPAVAKKMKKLSASGTVLGLIQGSPEGIETATLKKMTGFANAKIHMTVYKLKKQGKIKSEKRGIYVKA